MSGEWPVVVLVVAVIAFFAFMMWLDTRPIVITKPDAALWERVQRLENAVGLVDVDLVGENEPDDNESEDDDEEASVLDRLDCLDNDIEFLLEEIADAKTNIGLLSQQCQPSGSGSSCCPSPAVANITYSFSDAPDGSSCDCLPSGVWFNCDQAVQLGYFLHEGKKYSVIPCGEQN